MVRPSREIYANDISMDIRPLQVVVLFLIRAYPKTACGRAGFAIMPLCILTIVHSKPQGTNHSSHPTTVGACAVQTV